MQFSHPSKRTLARISSLDRLASPGISRKVFPYVEDHLFYVEHWFHSLFWNKVREVANILVEADFIKDTEDIWYMKRGEIRDALWDYCTSWATGSKGRGPSYWPKEIAWRNPKDP